MLSVLTGSDRTLLNRTLFTPTVRHPHTHAAGLFARVQSLERNLSCDCHTGLDLG